MPSIIEQPSVQCQFEICWVGRCKTRTTNGWCNEHEHLKCASCGEKAITSCDHTSGPLCCGAPLCKNCTHSLLRTGADHVTREIYEKQRAAEVAEENAKKDSRISKERRLDETTQLPLNTFELLKGDWRAEGYELADCYFLHLDHGLMGFHPALIIRDKKDEEDPMIFTAEKELAFEVWRLLPPRKSKMDSQLGYIHLQKKTLYPYSKEVDRQEELKPQPLLDRLEFQTLLVDPQKNFGWAPGLFGCSCDQDTFLRMIERVRAEAP